MSEPLEGGPAFPSPDTRGYDGVPGMTLRDWFAGMAMQGLLASGHFTRPQEHDDQAWMAVHEDPWDDETGEEIHQGRYRFDFPEAAWKCADAMLAERERKEDA